MIRVQREDIDVGAEIAGLTQGNHKIGGLAIPHHTAYRARNRGKDWDYYDPEVSPFVEVYSVHGSSEGTGTPVGMHQNSNMGPRVSGGSWQEWTTNDGWSTGLRTAWWYGHQCQFGSGPYGPCDFFLTAMPAMWWGYQGTGQVGGAIAMLTDAFGNGCDVAACPLGYCSAGVNIDDTWIECVAASPVEESSWGAIKSMYR